MDTICTSFGYQISEIFLNINECALLKKLFQLHFICIGYIQKRLNCYFKIIGTRISNVGFLYFEVLDFDCESLFIIRAI